MASLDSTGVTDQSRVAAPARALLGTRGMWLRHLYPTTGLDHAFLSEVLAGKKTPSPDVLDSIVDACMQLGRGVSLDEVRQLEYIAKQPAAPSPEALQAQLDHFATYYSQERPYRALGWHTPQEVFDAKVKARPEAALATHFRVRYDKVDGKAR